MSEMLLVKESEMLRVKEAAAYVNIPVRTWEVHYLLWDVPHFQVGRRIMFRKSELDTWMEKHRRR
jgi:Helix-turn-helix domain